MQKEWWNTPMAAWAFTAIGIGGGTVLTFVSPYVGIPIGAVIFAFGIWLLIRAYGMKRKALKSTLMPREKQLQLDLGKLLLDGKEILVDLEKMNAQLDSTGVVTAELKCEMWYKDASKTLQNTDYDRLWFENKEGLDYRTANKSDYVEACKYGLGRLEYIKQLIFDKEGSLSLGNGIQPIIIARDKQKVTNSQIQDVEMGKHRTRIVELLNIWKEQLSLMIKSKELGNIVAEIERNSEFQAILQHIPSITKKCEDLRLNRALYEAKLAPVTVIGGEEIERKATKQEIAENKKWLNEKMQSVVVAIDESLRSNEYTKTKCDWCPKDMR